MGDKETLQSHKSEKKERKGILENYLHATWSLQIMQFIQWSLIDTLDNMLIPAICHQNFLIGHALNLNKCKTAPRPPQHEMNYIHVFTMYSVKDNFTRGNTLSLVSSPFLTSR